MYVGPPRRISNISYFILPYQVRIVMLQLMNLNDVSIYLPQPFFLCHCSNSSTTTFRRHIRRLHAERSTRAVWCATLAYASWWYSTFHPRWAVITWWNARISSMQLCSRNSRIRKLTHNTQKAQDESQRNWKIS